VWNKGSDTSSKLQIDERKGISRSSTYSHPVGYNDINPTLFDLPFVASPRPPYTLIGNTPSHLLNYICNPALQSNSLYESKNLPKSVVPNPSIPLISSSRFSNTGILGLCTVAGGLSARSSIAFIMRPSLVQSV
jgi:hypothetical protein